MLGQENWAQYFVKLLKKKKKISVSQQHINQRAESHSCKGHIFETVHSAVTVPKPHSPKIPVFW